MGILIKNGKIWNNNRWFDGDIFIDGGYIKEIADKINISNENNEIYDAKGNIVIPGLIDLHVHLREPGFEDKETIATGSKAAVAGGFTTIAAMPNTNPIIDRSNLITFIKEKAKEIDFAKVYPIGAITIGEKGLELTDFKGMKDNGAIGFSDDGKGIQTASVMKQAMDLAYKLNVPIFAHCEDESLVHNGVINNGRKAKELNFPGISSESEYIQLARDLMLANITKVHYHACHVSTKESVQLIKYAKSKGIRVTAEAAPHHLVLTEEDICHPYSLYKVNPPLRTEEDRLALINGLLDGTIDIIASDHAPHTTAEKEKDVLNAPFGMIGLDITFPLLYTKLVKANILPLELLINKLTMLPASLINLTTGIIQEGYTADITVIDVSRIEKVNPEFFISKGRNTPFTGEELFGWPVLTIVDGKIKWRRD